MPEDPAREPRPEERIDRPLPLDDSLFSTATTQGRIAAPTAVSEQHGGRPLVPGYEILEELGRGGMGVVYKARQVHLNRIVALKMILAGGHAATIDHVRFLAEAEAIASVKHPGIVQVYDFGTHEGLPYFSLEFCEGGSLARLLSAHPLPPKEAAHLVEQVAHAVQAAHEQGIVHRDLKPANILIADCGLRIADSEAAFQSAMVKITDFGLAKRIESGPGLTASGAIMGTPSYMAPEQAEGKKDVGLAADVYALGAILYECLTGRPPFKAATTFDTIIQVVTDEPVPPRQLNAKVPKDLETVTLKCLEKEPSRRYGSALALAEDLGRFLAGQAVQARPIGPLERLWRWGRRSPITAALTGAVAILLLTGTLVAWALAAWALAEKERANEAATAKEQETIRAEAKAGEAADSARLAAERERHALAQEKLARQEKQKADIQKQQADAQRDRAERSNYVGKLALAQSAWKDNNAPLALERLNECQSNLRGWEHRHLWNLYTSNQVVLRGHMDLVNCVAFSPDGKRIASAGEDNMLKLWDARTGQDMFTLAGHTDHVNCLAYSPDGKRIVSGSGDKTLKVWDAATGQEICTIRGRAPTGAVSCVAFSPDGRRILCAGPMKEFDAETGREIRTLRGHTGIMGLAYSPNGKHIVSGSTDSTLKLWDGATGRAIRTLAGHARQVQCVAFSPDGKRIVSGSWDNTLKVWDVATGREVFTLKGHTNWAYCVAFSPDGKHIVSGSYDQTLKIWDASTGQEIGSRKGHTAPVYSVAYSPDGKRIVSGGHDRTLIVWDAEKGQEPLSFEGHSEQVRGLACSSDGKRIASCSFDNTLKVWDVETGREVFTLTGHTDDVIGVAFSPDGKYIVSGSRDQTAKVWDARTGREIRTLRGHTQGVSSVAYSPDGKRIVSGSYDTTLKFWEAETGREIRTLKGHGPSVHCVAYSPDGKRIVSGGTNSTLKLWDAQTCREIRSFRGRTAIIFSARFSPDGRRIVCGSADGTIKVWDTETGRTVFSVKAHMHPVFGVVYSPDGERIVSCSQDNTIKVYRATTGEEVLHFVGHRHGAFGVTFTPDGNRLVSSGGRTLKVWNAERQQRTALDRAFLQRLARPDPEYHRRKAEKYEKSGDLFAAVFHLRRLVLIAPTDQVRTRLTTLQEKLGAQTKSGK